MRAFLIGILLLSSWVTLVSAHADEGGSSPIDLASKAEKSFREGVRSKSRLIEARKQFSDATDAYLDLSRQGMRNPGLYRNLGNAAVLADRWPEALWAYHTGLKLDPNDRMMREHLAFARGKVLYPPSGQGRPETDPWPAWLPRLTLSQLLVMFLLIYAGAWIVGARAWVTRSPNAILLTTALVAITFVVGAAGWVESGIDRNERDTPLVIMAVNADFHRGNGSRYPKHPVLPVLPRGLEARQSHRRGDWLQIRLTTGETGWVHATQTLIVEP